MLSDKVEVQTKHIEENQIIKIEFEKNSEYICLTYENKTKLKEQRSSWIMSSL